MSTLFGNLLLCYDSYWFEVIRANFQSDDIYDVLVDYLRQSDNTAKLYLGWCHSLPVCT